MAYYTGIANTLADLLTALQSACTANGWTLAGQVLRKGNCYTSLAVVASDIQVTGGTGVNGSNALLIPGPQPARIGASAPSPLVYPLTYNIHVLANPDEVYLFVNYSVNRWQWLAFGCSPVPGAPGTGGWYGASGSTGAATLGYYITADTAGGYSNSSQVSGALFGQSGGWVDNTCVSSYMHIGLEGVEWALPTGYSSIKPGVVDAFSTVQPLLGRQPNSWNGETSLLPIQVMAQRSSGKASLVGQMVHARYMRNDNYADGDVITLGSDRWKTYPWAQKNSAARAGGASLPHSGTFGVAIRYDGA